MRNQKPILVLAIVMTLIAMPLILPGLISAGDLEPPGPPGSTMCTLEEICDKLDEIDGKLEPLPCEGAPVAKTGQTTCSDTSGAVIDCEDTGQDGAYQKGVGWPHPRFTDNGDGTVTDNLTGLIWLKDASCFGNDSWADALTVCNNLEAGYCGLADGSVPGDWRLPNVKELQSLIDYGAYDPALPSGHPFTDLQSGAYWSSTSYVGYGQYAWYVDLYNGYVMYGPGKEMDNLCVWPVRGGD
ncbi:MAG: DUF1566 domain-containing protein [Thermodesulfobacteriota bacterium]|nr:DUF1566 domain-containing protein [Thermodesulfobacteriota bacterium]